MDVEVSVTAPSKKALKREKKRERLAHLKELRKASRKEKKKEKRERQKGQLQNVQQNTRAEDKARLKQAKETAPRLVIDLSLSNLMTEKEICSLCRQLTTIYVQNKRSHQPFHLNFTSFTGPFKESFERFSPTYHNWIIDIHEESFLEVFSDEKRKMVYLTADAPANLMDLTLEGETPRRFAREWILIIGGLIDRNRHKNICHEKAMKHDIMAARLPLHLLEGMNKGLSVLTTNQCAEMLLRYQESMNWSFAVSSTYPKRKLTTKQSAHQDTSTDAVKMAAEQETDVKERQDDVTESAREVVPSSHIAEGIV